MKTLIVFSHLRWDFVYQRPQQLLSRLAKKYRVFFVEEPVFDEAPAHWEFSTPATDVLVCRPHSPVGAAGFHDEQIPVLRALLQTLIHEQGIKKSVVWVYTPMALPLIAELKPLVLVYDCMDELAAFKNAPRQLLQREHALLKVADLVFAGGLSLFKAKQSRHDDVHCFPSSVDIAHFAAAREPALDCAMQRSLPHPRLGFFGVIDERFDVQLVDSIARAHPDWQLIMVGPVVKIDRASLPKYPNIHYFGQQAYEELPSFLAGWDVCLLPFAMNDSTRYISPTKTLEYMAAGKPIVSTPVSDVVTQYGHIVRIGAGLKFIEACEAALAETAQQREQSAQQMREIVASTSWDATVEAMAELIEAREPVRREVGDHAPVISVKAPDLLPLPAKSATRVVIIGAGPTGLSAAYSLGTHSVLLEQNSTVGGWCRSINDHGFSFDYAGHIMFSNDPYVHELYDKLLGDNVHWQDREAWIYSKGIHTRYPFQGALFGLPANVVSECLVGAIEARVGPLKQLSTDKPSLDLVVLPVRPGNVTPPKNFEEFIFQVWGKGIAKHFALPYNRKLWAVPLASMETSWLGGRVPMPDLKDMIEGALAPVSKPMGPNARFGYPLKGGFQALMDGFLPLLQGELRLNASVVRVMPAAHRVIMADGEMHAYEKLISTMPLPHFITLMGEEAPIAVQQAAARLRHVSVRCVNLGIDRANLTDKHWIYYPEDSVFHRIFVQGNASPHCNPPNGFGLTCEITYSPDKPLPCESDELIDLCIEDCIKVGMFTNEDRVIARNQVDMPYAYVVYDHERAANVAIIRDWAAQFDIILAGRYSEWEYYNSDHAFIAGRDAALSAQSSTMGKVFA
jgi:UDP-galactopyranose mutase